MNIQTQNIIIKATSVNQITLNLYSFFLIKLFNKLNISYSIFFLPKKKKKITLLKSPHVHKKAREQFQLMTYSFLIKITSPKILAILQLNLPKTIEMTFFSKTRIS